MNGGLGTPERCPNLLIYMDTGLRICTLYPHLYPHSTGATRGHVPPKSSGIVADLLPPLPFSTGAIGATGALFCKSLSPLKKECPGVTGAFTQCAGATGANFTTPSACQSMIAPCTVIRFYKQLEGALFGQLRRKILRRARARGNHVYIASVIGPRLAIFAAAVVALFWLPLQANMPQWLAC